MTHSTFAMTKTSQGELPYQMASAHCIVPFHYGVWPQVRFISGNPIKSMSVKDFPPPGAEALRFHYFAVIN
jgi:hypothetical protein